MCERLFIHIGEFRTKASDYFKSIVDDLHNPLSTGPKPTTNNIESLAAYLDEEDDRLYVAPEPNNEINKVNFSMQG